MRFLPSVLVVMALLFGSETTIAEDPVDEFTASITAELEEANPQAAGQFVQANESRDRGEFREAEALYRKTLILEPNFHHAKRRLSGVVLMQGRRIEALALTREVLEEVDSPENRAARISALAWGDSPTKQELNEAVALAEQLIARSDLDYPLIIPVCEAALADENQALLFSCVTRLKQVAPNEMGTHIWGWVDALARGDLELAKEELELARETGLEEEVYADLSATTGSARPPLQRLLAWSWRVGAIWLIGLLLLMAIGFTLSRLTLAAAAQLTTAPSGEPVGLSASLRNIYRKVLWLTCGYYFLSLPFVLLAVIGLGIAAVLWILTLELIPIKLLAIIVGVVVVTVVAVVRSLTIRPSEMDPGQILDLKSNPNLKNVLSEVAQEIDTRAVDNVYLTPGTDLAVMERGGVLNQLRGMPERCLILGVGVLDGMKVGPFKAILGHEYGHFSNRDTAGGGFALAVTRSIYITAVGLAEGGAAAWYNPAWLFLICFNWVFLVVSQGASRLQEILADRWAVLAYGSQQFEHGLRHVIERSIRFDARASAILEPMFETEVVSVSPNFYLGTPKKPVPEPDIEQAIETAIHAKASLADSHPSPEQRLEFVRSQTQIPTGDLGDSEEDVWDLFADREEIERSMSRQIWMNTGMVAEEDLEAVYA